MIRYLAQVMGAIFMLLLGVTMINGGTWTLSPAGADYEVVTPLNKSTWRAYVLLLVAIYAVIPSPITKFIESRIGRLMKGIFKSWRSTNV